MILYLDTSSLVKLYVEEPGSDVVRRLVAAATRVAVSILASFLSLRRRMPRRGTTFSSFDRRLARAARRARWPARY